MKLWQYIFLLMCLLSMPVGVAFGDHIGAGINHIPVLVSNITGEDLEDVQVPFSLSSETLVNGSYMDADGLNTDMKEGVEHLAYMPGTGMVQMLACFDNAGVNETTDCNDFDSDDVTLPATMSEVFEFAADNQFRILHLNISTAAVANWTIEWQYWDGDSYEALSNVSDGSDGFTMSGLNRVTWDFPAEGLWPESTLHSIEGYWVRAEVTAVNTFTSAPLGQQVWYETGRWWTFAESIGANEQKRYDLHLDTEEKQTFHWYFPHDDGYTLEDNATLEPGTDFEIRFVGIIDLVANPSLPVILSKGDDLVIRGSNNTAERIIVRRNGSTVITADNIESGYHTITLSQMSGGDLTLQIDGVVVGSATAAAVTDNATDWVFAQGSIAKAMESLEMDISGSPVIFHQIKLLPGLLLRNGLTPPSVNQITNPGFETDLTGWTRQFGSSGTSVQTTAESRTGVGSLEIDLAGTAVQEARFQDLSASPGQIWDVEVWVKGDSFTGDGSARLVLFWRGSGAGISFATATTTDVSGNFVRLAIEDQIAPEGTDTARIILDILVAPGSGSGKAWFDDVSAQFTEEGAFDAIARYPDTPSGLNVSVQSTEATMPVGGAEPEPGPEVLGDTPAIDDYSDTPDASGEGWWGFDVLCVFTCGLIPYQALTGIIGFAVPTVGGVIAARWLRHPVLFGLVIIALSAIMWRMGAIPGWTVFLFGMIIYPYWLQWKRHRP